MRNLAILALATALWAMAGVSGSHADEPKYGGTLRVGAVDDMKTLDPMRSADFGERKALFLIYDTLLTLNSDFQVAPSLAKSWKVADDGLSVTFELEQGVQFHDGTPFNASAAKWNLDKRMDPETRFPQRPALESAIRAVEVVDDYTLRIDLTEPAPAILPMLCERAGYMVSPTAYGQMGSGDFGSQPVGTGPFKFVSWTRGLELALEKNENYWKEGLPYLDRIVLSNTAGALIGTQRLIAGELDFVAELSPQDVVQLRARDDIRLVPATGRWIILQSHVDKPPFEKLKLRQAIAHGIDRERLNAIVMLGQGVISNGPTPPEFWWHNPDVKTHEYDVEKAKALLEEAGIPPGFDLTLSTPAIPLFSQINQLVAEQLKDIGLDVTLESVAASDYYAKIRSRITNFTPVRWTQRADPDGLYYTLFHPNGRGHTTGYQNEEVFELLEAGRQVYDQQKRKEIYFKVQEILAEDLPVWPLLFMREYAAIRDNVRNFEWVPDLVPRYAYLWKE